MLRIQEELRRDGLEDVAARYNLRHKRHGRHPNLVLFKYDQIDSPVGERAVWDCRALILDEHDGWRAVAFPYRRFFNHGEVHADPLDWASARVYEKEDGSLITLYHYAGEWHASTSGTPDGSSPIQRVYERGEKAPGTFGGRFMELLPRLPDEAEKCFMFELCTSENRILVEHAHPRVVLHGVRDMDTLLEEHPEPYAEKYGWEMCRSHQLGTLEEILEAAKTLKPNESEGYVVRDNAFNRVKVKAPQYVALHHTANGNSPRRLLEMIRTGESAEWLAYFPSLRQMHDEVSGKMDALVDRIEKTYAEIAGIESQKEFASHATEHDFSGVLFKMRRGMTARAMLKETPIDRLCEMVGVEREDSTQSAA